MIFARIIKSASLKPGTLVRLADVGETSVRVVTVDGRWLSIDPANLQPAPKTGR